MLSKVPLVCCVISLFLLNTIPPTNAFGTDLLEQLTDLLFGSDESSEESEATIINTKPNATLTVVCQTGCDLNVMCINCTNVNAVMMPAPANGAGNGGANGSGSGNGSGGGNGNGNGATTTQATTTTAATAAEMTTVAGGRAL